MGNIWKNDKAFAPCCSDTIAIEGVRASGRYRVTCKASVLPDGFDMPLSDDSTSSACQSLMVDVLGGDWHSTVSPDVGDIVHVLSSVIGVDPVASFAVVSREAVNGGYHMRVRSAS